MRVEFDERLLLSGLERFDKLCIVVIGSLAICRRKDGTSIFE